MIATRRDDIVEDYHGTPIADPYRWLEDPDAAETRAWVDAQNARTRAWLDAIPAREENRQRLTRLWDFPRHSIPSIYGGRTFFMRNDGLQNQAVLYVRDTPDAEPRLLLDPNTLSEDGTVALTGQAVSEDGRLLAWAASGSGSDWQEIRIRDVESGRDLPDVVRWCKFAGIAWKHDGSGFFYNRLPEPGTVPPEDQNNYSRVCFHVVGTDQSADPVVYERPEDKTMHFTPGISDDGRYLILVAGHGADPRTRIYYRDLAAGDERFVHLLDDEDALYAFIDNDGPVFYVLTDLDAPRRRLIAIDTANPDREHWRTVLPEGEEVLDDITPAGERFAVVSMRDARHRLRLYRRDGALEREMGLPDVGSIESLWGRPGNPNLFVGFTSFLYPSTPFRCDPATGDLAALHPPAIDFDPAGCETRQVFATSKDGTRVPMFLVHRRGLPLDGSNPTLLYGYGGFNISLTPDFSIHRLLWLERGGVYAVANLRGGSEYGEEWHQAGMLERKQNVFDDFIACAEWLIANGITSTPKLAINGGSNGGLLTGACLTQRPDLYGAVVCEVPVVDMLRYHKFTVGHFWVPEYGDAESNPEHFRFLLAYSPLHNVHPGTRYPPTLITSADTDDRVVPAHAKKFAATLQASQAGDNPILLRVETKAGHGAGKPTSKIIDERADVYAFLTRALAIQSG